LKGAKDLAVVIAREVKVRSAFFAQPGKAIDFIDQLFAKIDPQEDLSHT